MKPAAFKSEFALLDVKTGRNALVKRLQKGPVKVRVDMLIGYAAGHDDGTSIEFSCHVLSVKEMAR